MTMLNSLVNRLSIRRASHVHSLGNSIARSALQLWPSTSYPSLGETIPSWYVQVPRRHFAVGRRRAKRKKMGKTTGTHPHVWGTEGMSEEDLDEARMKNHSKRTKGSSKKGGATGGLGEDSANDDEQPWDPGVVMGEMDRLSLTGQEEELKPIDDDEELMSITEDEYLAINDTALPWASLLLRMAKASWRTSSQQPPSDVVEASREVLEASNRTNRQLKRCFLRIVDGHIALGKLREIERMRIKYPRGTGGDSDNFRPGSLAFREQKAKESKIKPIYYQSEQVFAALHNRFLPNFAIVKRVLLETKSLLPDLKPSRILDFGIGCGSASAAVVDVFCGNKEDDDQHTIEWIHGIDPSKSMQDCAKRVLHKVVEERDLTSRITLSGSLISDGTKVTTGASGGFDIALMTYTALEIPHVASTIAAAAVLWEKLRPGGVFIMVEPGNPDGFGSVRAVRSMLLECCPAGEGALDGDEECHIIAPCTHNAKCPMERHKLPKKKSKDDQRDVVDEEFDSDTEDDDSEDEEDEDEETDGSLDGQGDVVEVSSVPSQNHVENVERTDEYNSSFCSFVHFIPGSNNYKGEKLCYLVAQKRIAGDESIMLSETEDPNIKHNEASSNLGDDAPEKAFQDENLGQLLRDTYDAGRGAGSARRQRRFGYDEDHHFGFLDQAMQISERVKEMPDQDKFGLDLLRTNDQRSRFGRIIRAPTKRKRHVVVEACGQNPNNQEEGLIVRHRVGKMWSRRVCPGQYHAARKARWGGYWPNLLEPDEEGIVDLNEERYNEEELADFSETRLPEETVNKPITREQ